MPHRPHPRSSLKRRRPIRRDPGRHTAAGFSLVELMISTLIFAMVTAGSLGMFTITTRQATLTRRLQEEEFAIRMDLATIMSMNDRFSCASGTCQISSASPGQNDYYPSSNAAETKFTTLCSNGQLTVVPNSTFGTGLVSLINATNRTSAMQSLGISRSAGADTTSPAAHRYTVTWSGSDGSVLRQISLVPTTAAWCP